MANGKRARGMLVPAALALALFGGACSRSAPGNSGQANASGAVAADSSASNSANASGVIADMAKLDAEVDRLEKQAEKNPADEDSRVAVAKAYVKRGNSLRDARRMREALLDYQNALRNDPDNEEAQKNVAEISPLVEGTPTGENGEPAPLPISPNVAGSDDEKPSPTATPKKP